MEFSNFLKNVFDENIHLDTRYWICDIHLHQRIHAIMRNITPQEVSIVDNSRLPPQRIVYYSPVHFRPIGLKGQVKKQIIVPFDSSGRDENPGVGVLIFETKEECVKAYNEQFDFVLAKISADRLHAINRSDQGIRTINDDLTIFSSRLEKL